MYANDPRMARNNFSVLREQQAENKYVLSGHWNTESVWYNREKDYKFLLRATCNRDTGSSFVLPLYASMFMVI